MPEEKPLSPQIRSGTVTALRFQKRNTARVSVFVDGEYSFGVHGAVISRLGISKDGVVSEETIEQAVLQDAEHRARAAAYDLLSYRARTRSEIVRRLCDKGFSTGTVELVLGELVASGLVDDFAFASEFVAQRIRSRSHGAARIRVDLLKRGVDAETVDLAIQNQERAVDWRSKAMESASRKWRSMPAHIHIDRRRKRVYDHLARRGFGYDVIREVVAEIVEG